MKFNIMKITALLMSFLSLLFVKGQEHYTIEYDKLSDQTSYFHTNFEHGKRMVTPVEKIELSQGDVVKIRIVNVNEFVFSSDIKITGKEKPSKYNKSPLLAALGAFSPMFGWGSSGALSMLIGMSSNTPDRVVSTRGNLTEQAELMQQFKQLIYDGHTELKELVGMVATYEKSLGVLYSKELSYKQIESTLNSAVANFSGYEIENKLDNVELIINELERLQESQIDTSELKELNNRFLSKQIDQNQRNKEYTALKNSYFENKIKRNLLYLKSQFKNFKDEYAPDGYFYQESFEEILEKFYSEDFVVEHIFVATNPSSSYYPLSDYKSIEYILLFNESSPSGDASIDYSKTISVPVKEPYSPSWSFGVYFVNSFAGFNDYSINEYSGYDPISWESFDSINISSSLSYIKPSIGTQLVFDIPTNGGITPNVSLGASVRFNNDDTKYINVLLGGGIKFNKIKWMSITGGLVLCQTKVLKEDYQLNQQFETPSDLPYNYDDPYAGLFENVFKPGLYFGINLNF
jgi:hypothetical protein